MNSLPHTFETGADHGLRAAFAVGACQVNDARQPILWIAQSAQQPPSPI